MPIIPDEDRQYLSDLFSDQLVDPVSLRFYTERPSKLTIPGRPERRECETCQDANDLLDELVSLSDKLELDIRDYAVEEQQARAEGIEEIPAIVLDGGTKGTVRFIGIPAGYEFATLIEDLVDVSRGTTGLQDETKQALAGLTDPVHIKVFVTPT